MSPPGIVMLYASDSPDTALRETAAGPATFAIGEFETLKPVPIVDLTRLPDVPSLFELDDGELYAREELIFLRHFTRDVAKPIARDDRIHLEYVPTQVVTEYVRTSVQTADRSRVMGIRYPSARDSGRNSLVLFADRSNVEPSPGDGEDLFPFQRDFWIRLITASQRTLPKPDADDRSLRALVRRFSGWRRRRHGRKACTIAARVALGFE